MPQYDAETKTWQGPKIPYTYSMDVTFGELVLKNLSKTPDRILQIFADDETTLSCEQLRISSIRIAQNLHKIGIEEDDAIGLITHNNNFTTCFITGCVLVGAIVHPLDGELSEEDIFNMFSESKPKLIVCDGEFIKKMQSALKNVDFNYRIYSSTDATSTYHLKATNFLKPTGHEEIFKYPKFSKPSDEKLLMILCSSGTTDKPKSVCGSHAGYISTLGLSLLYSVETENKRSILFSPLYWATGMITHLGISFTQNETRIWTKRKFSVETFIELVERYQITNVLMAPYVLRKTINSLNFQSSRNDSLQTFFIGGTILSEETRKKFDEVLPNRILLVGYGMTEQVVTVTKPFEYRQGLSVGSVIFPNISVKITDDDGNSLENGEIGEICVASTLKFLGYYNNPEATSQLLDGDGFIKTGDIGYFNSEGMLSVVDRKKDIFKYKGIHINPSDIENVIETIEGVQAVSVVGIPDDECVNLVTAVVVKRDGFENLNERAIIDFVASKVPEYKRLRGGVYFFNEFPTTLSDKIKKRSVLEEILKLRKK